MGSEKLAKIQAAIKRLTDAREAGLAEEIAAAQALLSSPLSSDLTPQQVLAEGKANLGRFEKLIEGQERIANLAKAANDGINITVTNLEGADRLGIAPEIIDAKIDDALGIAGQAQNLFIDTGTGIVIRGEKVGELRPKDKGIAVISALAGATQPLGQTELTAAIFGKKADQKPTQTRAIVSKVNAWAQESGLPQPVERAAETGYALAAAYQVIGIERSMVAAEPTSVIPASLAEVRPETLTLSQVLEADGIRGKMTDVRLRHLAQELVASGNLRVGEHVMEKIAGTRNYLEYTPAGVDILKRVAKKFGDQGKIYVETVRGWLDAEKEITPAPEDKTGRVYWGSQIADAAGIPTTALEVLQDIGAFQPGVHFRVEERGETDKKLRVYTDEALKIARRVGKFAKKERQNRFTKRLIQDAVGIHEAPTENPFGENGPATFTPAIECRLLRTVKYCLPAIRARVGDESFLADQEQLLNVRLGQLMTELGNERDSAVLKLEKQISDETEREKVIADQARTETLLAAATAFDLINNRRPFNFLHKKHPGLDVVGDLIDGLKETMPNLLEEFPPAIIELPTPVVQTTPDRSVNGRILVGNLGHRKK